MYLLPHIKKIDILYITISLCMLLHRTDGFHEAWLHFWRARVRSTFGVYNTCTYKAVLQATNFK